ncbi:MAG: serine/threonine protein kinase [Myxococcota bacterium]|nr:serine/threonine protein kinase [Myxococcota bacterium]
MIREGDRVADYEIVARMKAGGMATLFLGRRTGASGFSKPVAIKVVHAHLADDPSFVEMFVDEALLCARIQHPNVVHVEELRESNGTHLLVMEYVAGCSLGQLLRALAKRQRRMTPELAVHVAIHVLDGLHAAHELKNEQGAPMEVVHRDVSPDNVLLAWQGHVKLIDFGVAKAMSRRTQTSGSMLKGKIRYMSPEQAFGRAVDRRTDVYALAIVLWECLTMRRLFSGSGADLELLEQVRNPTIVPPSQLVSDLPPALDAILLKALAREANDRYASAREMRRALADAMPRAASLDGSDLAELLRAVMADEIEAQRAKLASDAEALDVPVVVDGAEADEPLRTMTISMAGLSSPSGLISAESSATSGTAQLPPASSASSTSIASPMAAPPTRETSRSSGLLYALGGGLLVALAGGTDGDPAGAARRGDRGRAAERAERCDERSRSRRERGRRERHNFGRGERGRCERRERRERGRYERGKRGRRKRGRRKRGRRKRGRRERSRAHREPAHDRGSERDDAAPNDAPRERRATVDAPRDA